MNDDLYPVPCTLYPVPCTLYPAHFAALAPARPEPDAPRQREPRAPGDQIRRNERRDPIELLEIAPLAARNVGDMPAPSGAPHGLGRLLDPDSDHKRERPRLRHIAALICR